MECINIISKEPILTTPQWVFWTILVICLSALAIVLFKAATKNFEYLFFGCCGIVIFEIISCIICLIFFQIPTGRYKYEGTINKDIITVAQYEEFIEDYEPTIKNGVYHWEDKIK